MKRAAIFLLVLTLLAAVCPAAAADGDTIDVSGVEDGLGEDEREVAGRLVTDGGYDIDGAISRLMERLKYEAVERMRSELASVTGLLAVVLLCALSESICSGTRAAAYIPICACAAIVAGFAGSVDGVFTQTARAINDIADYSRSAMLTVCTAAAASGAMVSSAAKYAAAGFCLDLIIELTERLTLPLIYAYTALAAARSVLRDPVLSSVVSAVKWLAITVMTVLTMGSAAYIGLVGAITGGADAAAVKAAKAVVSGALPVVGGIISDASSVVLASAGMIKSSAGAYALIVICVMCAAPFAALGVKSLVFKAVSAISSAFGGGRVQTLLSDLSGALAMMLGLLGSVAIMLFISFSAIIRSVGT